MYHVRGRKDHGDALDGLDIQVSTLAAVELAKHVLARLVDIQSIKRVAEEFDDDVQFINGVISFSKILDGSK